MNRFKNRLVAAVLFAALALMGVFMNSRQAVAQNEESVPARIKSLQNAVNTLQTSINALQTSINALGEFNQSNVRFTPQVDAFSPDVEYCQVVNVSSVTHIVRAQLIRYNGTIVQDTGNVSVPAGQSFAGVSASANAYCKFVVVDGTRNDIRGTLTEWSTVGSPSDKLSVSAE